MLLPLLAPVEPFEGGEGKLPARVLLNVEGVIHLQEC